MKPIEFVTIVLDKPRPLVLDMAALIRAERAVNKCRRDDGLPEIGIFNVFSGSDSMLMSAQFMSILLWAALVADDPSLTIDSVAAMIKSPLSAIEAIAAAIKAYTASASDEEEGGETDRPLDQLNGHASGRLPESN